MNVKITILEGPDGTGKTTLAEHLVKKLNGAMLIRHGPPPASGAYSEYMKTLTSVAEVGATTPIHAIIDRFHIGERVYGPLLRHHDSLGYLLQRQLERAIMSFDSRLVLCDPSGSAAKDAWKRRVGEGKELVTDATTYDRLRSDYFRYMRQTALDIIFYDYTIDTTMRTVTNQIDTHHRGRAKNSGPGIGMWHPTRSITIVGTEERPPDGIASPWPFMQQSGSSPFLTAHLIEHEIPERALYWVAPKTKYGSWTDPAFMADLEPRAVIALGKDGTDWCERYDIPHMSFDHPWHHRTFSSSQPYRLGTYLKELL